MPEMSADDINDLDEVVAELDLQASSKTPAEAVRELKVEIVRLRNALASVRFCVVNQIERECDELSVTMSHKEEPSKCLLDNIDELVRTQDMDGPVYLGNRVTRDRAPIGYAQRVTFFFEPHRRIAILRFVAKLLFVNVTIRWKSPADYLTN